MKIAVLISMAASLALLAGCAATSGGTGLLELNAPNGAAYYRVKCKGSEQACLAAAKARGVKLGWSIHGRQDEQRRASRKGVQAACAMADNHAANVLPAIREIAASGASLRRIAAVTNLRDVKTTRGGPWYATTVRNMLAREAKIEGAAT